MLTLATDNGFGNVKLCFNGKADFIQTAVSRPKDIGMAGIGMRSAGNKTKLVKFDEFEFCVGPGAWHKGTSLVSMDYLSITSRERTAAFYAGISLVAAPEEFTEEVCLVVGLPVPLLMDKNLAEPVIAGLKSLKREHVFLVDGIEYHINISKILKLPQPVGAYMNWYLDENLQTKADSKGKEAAVIDIGMNTFDEYVIRDSQVSDVHVGGKEIGVRYLLESIRTNGHDITELDADLRAGRLKPKESDLEEWIGVMMGEINRTLKSLRRYEVVIPVGGGVTVAGDLLKTRLISSGAHLAWSQTPITDNVCGLWRYGAKMNQKKD